MTESLILRQFRFSRMVSLLLNFAHFKGYDITFGDAYRDARCRYGIEKSFHRNRLAIDLNLFKNGVYQRKTEDHKELGEFWESIGGSWGGRWNDGNHYSFGENKHATYRKIMETLADET